MKPYTHCSTWADLDRPDGDKHAARVDVNGKTGEVCRDKQGRIRAVYPWLLIDVFSLPARKVGAK
jgi:hypothetical protein